MVRTAPRPQSVFRSSEFRRYYAGQALSYLGDGLRTLVIPLLVFHLTGSAVSLGLTFAFELLPFALFSLLGGSLADRLDRRKLMLGADAVRFLIMTRLHGGPVARRPEPAAALHRRGAALDLRGHLPRLAGLEHPVSAREGPGEGCRRYPGGNRTRREPDRAAARAARSSAWWAPCRRWRSTPSTYLTSQLSIASVASFGPERPERVPAGLA